MRLKYFSEEAFEELKSSYSSQQARYINENPEQWVEEYLKSKGINNFCKMSGIAGRDISLVYHDYELIRLENGKKASDAQINEDDLVNTRLIYDEYKNKLTPLQANDQYLWAALCHMDFSEYIVKRWLDKGEVDIIRYFASSTSSKSLCKENAISRLWWAGYLTYDEHSADPYRLTKILFSAQQVMSDLFDQPVHMNKKIVQGMLEALEKIQEERGDKATPVFRKCCWSCFNHYSVVAVLESLSVEEIKNLAYNYIIITINKNMENEIYEWKNNFSC